MNYHQTVSVAFGTMPPVRLVMERPTTRIHDIQAVVAHYYRLPLREMTSARRDRDAARPRQIAMALCREFTSRSLPEIGRMFGRRDHTTVMHAIRRIRELCAIDPDLADDLAYLRGKFMA